MKGAQVIIEVGLLTALVTSVVGVIAGLLAGFFRGWVDTVISGITYIGYGIPSLLIAFLILFITNRPSMLNVIVALSVTSWMDMARLVRGQTLALREREFVEAARATGTKNLQIMTRHVLPNALGPIIVQATFLIPQAILFEAFLSFLGFGLPAPDPSWGAMARIGSRRPLPRVPHDAGAGAGAADHADGDQLHRRWPTRRAGPEATAITPRVRTSIDPRWGAAVTARGRDARASSYAKSFPHRKRMPAATPPCPQFCSDR